MRKDVFDELIVVKRSGQRVNFNNYKVAVAIKSAFDSVQGNYNEKNINEIYANVLKYIETNYVSRKTINVEDIQDIIENELKNKKYYDVYREFNEYRKKRAESRQVFTIKQQHKFAKAMEMITDNNILNGDISYKPHEIISKYGNTVLNEYIKSYVIDTKYLRMHEEGNIYIDHLEDASLGRISNTNLMIEDFLKSCNGIAELCAYLINIKDEINGEIHLTMFDKLLSDCALKKFKEYLIEYLEIYLKIEGYDNYINIDSIKNIVNKSENLYILDTLNDMALNNKVKYLFTEAYNDSLKKLKQIISTDLSYFIKKLNTTNKPYSFSIGGTDNEICNLINEIILNIIDTNDKFSNIYFIYKLKRIDDKYIERIFTLVKANKNIIIQNISNQENIEYFSNGSRIYANYNDENYSNGRFIVSSTSINMARLGLIYKNNSLKEFYNKLEEILDLVKSELLLMFEIIGNKNKDNYNLLFDNNILYDEKLESGGKIRKVIKNSDLNIGLVGLKECIEFLESDIDKQYELLMDILKFINKKCQKYSEETKLNFYIYEPSNDNSRKYFMALDKSIYGIKKGFTDKEKYDLITDLKFLNNDYSKLGTIAQLITNGNMISKEIKDNLTYKKFIYILEEIINNNIGFIKFSRSSV